MDGFLYFFVRHRRFRFGGLLRRGRLRCLGTKGIEVAGLAAVFALVKPCLLDDVASFHQLV